MMHVMNVGLCLAGPPLKLKNIFPLLLEPIADRLQQAAPSGISLS